MSLFRECLGIELFFTDDEQTADQEPDETLIDHMMETEEMLQYLHTLWTKPEEETIALLYQNPNIVEDYIIAFKCAKNVGVQKEDLCCCCCDEAELCISAENSILYRIMVSVYIGVCPHILFLLSTKKTVLYSPTEFFQNKLRWNFKNLDIDSIVILRNRVSEYFQRFRGDDRVWICSAECGGSLLTYATALNKHQTIKAVLLGRDFSSYPSLQTKRMGISMLYLAVIKRNTTILQIFQKLKNSWVQNKLMSDRIYHDSLNPISACCDQGLELFHEYLKFVKKVVKNMKRSYWNYITRYALSYSLSEYKKDIVDYLIKKGTVLSCPNKMPFTFRRALNIMRKEYVGRKILESNDLDIMEKFLRCMEGGEEIGRLFEMAVLSGSIQMTELFLHKHKTLLRKMANQGKIQPATLTVIGGYESVLSLLFKYNIKEYIDAHKLSLTSWARLMNYPKCVSILFSNGVSAQQCVSKIAPTSNPFIEYLELTKDMSIAEVSVKTSAITGSQSEVSDSIPALSIIERLAENRFCDLNYEGPNGITPFQLALKQGRHDITKILMLHGADPFLGQCFLTTSGTLTVVVDMFYCNVNYSGNLHKVLNMIFTRLLHYQVEAGYDRYNGLQFLLDTISYLTERDRSSLIQNCPSSSRMRELVLEFLSTPRSLMRCCRDSLRWKFKNIGIFKYVKLMSVPEKLRRYLLIEEEVETCYRCSVYLPENRRLVIDFSSDDEKC